jgi:hypothetical protein
MIKFSNKKKITIGGIDYQRALETAENIFYINYEQPNKIGSVLMLDRKMNILDNSILAFQTLKQVKKEKLYSWSSEKMKKYLEV